MMPAEKVNDMTSEELNKVKIDVWKQFLEIKQSILQIFEDTENIRDLWVSGGVVQNQIDAFCAYADLFLLSPQIHKKCNRLKELFVAAQEMEIHELLKLTTDFWKMMEELEMVIGAKKKLCNVCNQDVFFMPMPEGYEMMRKKYGFLYWDADFQLESKENYQCPICKSYDRDRLMIAFLEELQAEEDEKLKMLQVAPSVALEAYALSRDDIIYESTDIKMQDVTFQADLQNLYMVEDETYDIIICSHVLEHIENDAKAMGELFRVLKPEGVCLVLVPLIVGKVDTDEEWGCSEEENWRRFAQDDHCRLYGKADFIQRLQVSGFYVNELGKSYFGEEFYNEYGFDDNSILYVATKSVMLGI